jgi:hypothetical protein
VQPPQVARGEHEHERHHSADDGSAGRYGPRCQQQVADQQQDSRDADGQRDRPHFLEAGVAVSPAVQELQMADDDVQRGGDQRDPQSCRHLTGVERELVAREHGHSQTHAPGTAVHQDRQHPGRTAVPGTTDVGF